MDAEVDILFKVGGNEYGVCKAGKYDVTIVDDEYIDDGLFKLPKTLRDMLSILVQKNPNKVNNLYTIGFLAMDVPVGHSITRLNKTPIFEFPSSVEVMSIDFLPLLELTWKGKELIKLAHQSLNDRKRKTIEFTADSSSTTPSLRYSFVRRSATL
ncbi:hypothetical protein MFLAVUS_007727 [Mucor flavus]|uniref:Uncharacterized protein n=1 Tax=Mucor flavus TaxID=439312 RepID=A0ABP9Z537_9FUNG